MRNKKQRTKNLLEQFNRKVDSVEDVVLVFTDKDTGLKTIWHTLQNKDELKNYGEFIYMTSVCIDEIPN
jgi:hypothetical protein